jgi:DNA-binding XRE family transcriptional regulator
MHERDVTIQLGTRLRRERMRRGMTIGDVAGATGLSRSTVSRLELGRGLRTPMESWIRVADVVGARLLAGEPAGRAWGIAEVTALAGVGSWAQRGGGGGDRVLHLQRPPHLVRGPFKPRMTPGEVAVLIVVDVLTDLHVAADLLAQEVASANGPDGWVVSGCLVVRRTAANQRRVTNGERGGRVFADSGSVWISALRDAEVRMPALRSMVWMDARATRLIPTRLRLRRAG